MLRTLLVATLFLYILYRSFGSPFAALLGYVWFALFRPQEWVWVDISALRLSLVLGSVLLIGCFMKKTAPNLSHPVSKGILAFLLTALVAQANAVNQPLGWQWLDYFARLATVCLLLISLVNTERRFFLLIFTIASSFGFHISKAGLASLLGGGVRFSDGLAGAFVDNNGYAIAGAMIIPLLIATASQMPAEVPFRKAIVWGYRAAVPLAAYAVISTFSRAGLLTLITVVLTYVMFQENRGKLLCLLFAAAVVVLPFVPMPEGYTQRMQTITTYEEENETSALSRLHFWSVAWKMAQENPLGVGLVNFAPNYNRYDDTQGLYGENRVVHNSHLQTLTENGFLGFGIWVSLFLMSFSRCLRIRRSCLANEPESEKSIFFNQMSVSLIVSMFGFIIGGTFISMSLNDLTWLLFGAVAALDRLYWKADEPRPATPAYP